MECVISDEDLIVSIQDVSGESRLQNVKIRVASL